MIGAPTGSDRHLAGQRCIVHGRARQRPLPPGRRAAFRLDAHTSALGEQQEFPEADRRQPQLVVAAGERARHRSVSRSGSAGSKARCASRGAGSLESVPRGAERCARRRQDVPTDLDRSPQRAQPLRAAAFRRRGNDVGDGLPEGPVTRTGRPVRRTRSSVARQVALNFEIAIVSCPCDGCTMVFAYGQRSTRPALPPVTRDGARPARRCGAAGRDLR